MGNTGNPPQPVVIVSSDAAGNAQVAGYANPMQLAHGCNYTQMSTNATTTIKTGAGLYYGVMVIGIGVTSSVVIFDSLTGSGQIIVPSLGTTLLGLLGNGGPSGVGIRFSTGLTVTTSGATPATILVLWA